MKKAKPRDLALLVLNREDEGFALSDVELRALWERLSWADERDRALATNLLQGVRRWRLRLDWILRKFLQFPFERLDPRILNILRIALYQICFMDRIPDRAAVDEAVRQAGAISNLSYLR